MTRRSGRTSAETLMSLVDLWQSIIPGRSFITLTITALCALKSTTEISSLAWSRAASSILQCPVPFMLLKMSAVLSLLALSDLEQAFLELLWIRDVLLSDRADVLDSLKSPH